jgi:hypothetical protein
MYIFIHVGKSGGSAFQGFLKKYKIEYKDIHTAQTRKDTLDALNSTCKKILTIRDPIRRHMSVFYFWRENYENYISPKHRKNIYDDWVRLIEPTQKFFKVFRKFEDVIAGLLSEDKEKKNLAKDLFSELGHMKQNLEYFYHSKEVLKKNKGKIIFIVEQERLIDDIHKFSKYKNISLEEEYLQKLRKDTEKEERKQKGLYLISEENRKFMKDFLKKEYEIYDYLKSIKNEVNQVIS